ncbi:uncharacterized protein ASCRUDRAFT_130171 [Ascoidea rubescens DSM 1968]|uniref:Uncharacterized protein n=1 Tax=Ascoidea rubescens DSM 1968 TaxID=1344418 RepID=A0A1D2V903_9ASCO|nr:hypothetical protein ASCRUDRAFT_130171 [Ascoidea rubescens DSM 1968]ODV57997.1 hypothetical protein ASCRUDRAFT_130171 [Ascoidea rubescens DSM 1968]
MTVVAVVLTRNSLTMLMTKQDMPMLLQLPHNHKPLQRKYNILNLLIHYALFQFILSDLITTVKGTCLIVSVNLKKSNIRCESSWRFIRSESLIVGKQQMWPKPRQC